DGPADPVIVHPDVRRMIMTTKAFAEGGRAMIYYLAMQGDVVRQSKDEEAVKQADAMMALLTPIAKAFLTEVGVESAIHGIQVCGGSGFIREWGAEQNLRDAKISTIYEGTTGIQALDLLGRKILMSQGQALRVFTKVIHKFCEANADDEQLKPFVEKLGSLNKEWGDLTQAIGMKAMQNPEEVGGASVDYLMYSGYICLAFFWTQMAKTANEKLAAGTTEEAFYKSKIATADFYFKRLLPRTMAHKGAIEGGLECLMAIEQDHFMF
ncbi:MAG: acyl-CoA dehydrogenase C-terminal domain-containing protein, partial [Alcanivoracaceae bacterium]